MRSLALALALLATGLAATSEAAKKRTYCQKAVAREKGKVVKKTNGVTVYRRGQSVSACSDKRRVAAGLYGYDAGYKVARVVAADSRCVAILFTGAGKLPELLFHELGGKIIGSSVITIGYGQPAGTVGSLAMSSNCAAAWGESVTDAAGTAVYRVRVKPLSAETSLKVGYVTEVATVAKPDDIAHVKIRAAGKQVTVGWTESGAARSKTLPEPPAPALSAR